MVLAPQEIAASSGKQAARSCKVAEHRQIGHCMPFSTLSVRLSRNLPDTAAKQFPRAMIIAARFALSQSAMPSAPRCHV